MKGIRKLFFGLILMTLIGVGFKIDAKATTNATIGEIEITDWGSASEDTEALKGTFSYSNESPGNAFPEDDGSTPPWRKYNLYRLQIMQNTTAVKTSYVALWTVKDASSNVSYHKAEGSTEDYVTNPDNMSSSITSSTTDIAITKSDVLDQYGLRSSVDSSNNVKGFKLAVTKYNIATSVWNEVKTTTEKETTMYPVTIAKDPTTVGITLDSDPERSTTPSSYAFLLPGESVKVYVETPGTDINYKFKEWVETGSITRVSAGTGIPEDTVKLNVGATAGGTVTAKYQTATLTFSNPNEIDTTNVVAKSGDKVTRTYTFTGYTGSNVSGVSVDGTSLETGDYSIGTGTNGTFWFNVPALSNGTHTLTLTMNDGNTFSRQFTVNDTTTVKFRSEVYVTVGKSTKLSNFLSSGATRSGYVTTDSTATGYVTIDPDDTLTVIGQANVTGGTVSEKSIDRISVTPEGSTAVYSKVTVYPKPSLTFNSSSSSGSLNSGSTSSSSADSPFKVTMPIAVSHDGIAWSDVTKARVVFSYDGKTKERDLDMGSSTSGLTRTASVDSMAVSDAIDDLVGDSDHYTIKITVYPMNGSTVDTGVSYSESVDVYKISLDGSSGARYYVNGSEKSGHFYAVKGTTYTIKSSAKNSGDRFQNWDDSVFSSESGGSYKVLGARTFKANYNNGSSSSSSSSSSSRNAATAGEGMDDYDDVPKTGESKADIWILWSVLFVSILGAGFMIWKRFGLVRAIAEADEEVAVAEHKEEVKAKKKEKEDKIKMLKDLRNL